MSEPNKDPAIKLFGAKIPVPDTQIPAVSDSMVCILFTFILVFMYAHVLLL